jgi:Secretion system C-terminal sorting domain
MKKLCWLTILVAACCCACQAQQGSGPDSVTEPGDSLHRHKPADSPHTLADSLHIPTDSLHTTGGKSPVNFTVTIQESNKVLLQWDAAGAGEGDSSAGEGVYFVVERSADGLQYQTIGVVSASGPGGHYELTDGTAPNGSDFYRIKYTARTGSPVYSKIMELSLSGAVDFKFYPNPVDKLFIVRTEHTIDLQVIDAAGAIRLSKRLQSGIQVVNVSSLERGVYILRVTDKESNRAISHQMVKN